MSMVVLVVIVGGVLILSVWLVLQADTGEQKQLGFYKALGLWSTGLESSGWRRESLASQRFVLSKQGVHAELTLQSQAHTCSFELVAQLPGDFPANFHFRVHKPERMFQPSRSGRALEASVGLNVDIHVSQLINIMDNESRGALAFEDAAFDDRAITLFDQCFASNRIQRHAPAQPLTPSRFSITEGVLTMHGSFANAAARIWQQDAGNASGIHHVAAIAGEVLREVVTTLTFARTSTLEIILNLSTAPQVSAATRDHAIALRDARHSPAELIAWFADQVLAAGTPPHQRVEALEFILARSPHSPHTRRILEAARDTATPHMHELLIEHGLPLLERVLRGKQRMEWLNFLFGQDRRTSEGLNTLLARFVTQADLLHEELLPRARAIILTNLMQRRGDTRLGVLLNHIIETYDDEELILFLNVLREHGGEPSARALVVLAQNPRKLDLDGEFKAMLLALQALSETHAGILQEPAIEHFLCSCLFHPQESIRALVPATLQRTGSAISTRRLMQMIERKESSVSAKVLKQLAQAITERVRSESSHLEGALSVAKQQGGELSVASEKGSISLTGKP